MWKEIMSNCKLARMGRIQQMWHNSVKIKVHFNDFNKSQAYDPLIPHMFDSCLENSILFQRKLYHRLIIILLTKGLIFLYILKLSLLINHLYPIIVLSLKVSFTIKELREMTKLEGCKAVFDPDDFRTIQEKLSSRFKHLCRLLFRLSCRAVSYKTCYG